MECAFRISRCDAVILDDDGRFLRMAEIHETGTLAIKGPNVFSGYLDAEHNKDAWIDIEGEPWLNTGDLGRQDEDGRFWLSGRRKELIIRSGHNIDPKLIEDALLQHPAVALAAAIARPDAYAGEIPVAYVQTQPGTMVTGQELLDFATASIPERAAVPKQVKIVPALPMTGVGKIFKPALQQLEIETVVRAEALNIRRDHCRSRACSGCAGSTRDPSPDRCGSDGAAIGARPLCIQVGGVGRGQQPFHW